MNLKPVKILHVISDMRRGGRERQLSILASNSNSSTENHIIAFYNTKNSYLNEYDFQNVHFLEKTKFKRISDIINYVKKNKIDIIHTWGNSETLYALPASWFCRIPLLNGSIRHGIRQNNFSHRFRSVILKTSGYLIGNSNAGFEANKIKIYKNRHFIIYNGIEEKFFTTFNKENRARFNSAHQLPPDSIVFISIANFIPYKDYRTILKSLSEIFMQGIVFHYIIVGKGPLLNETKNLIKSLGLDKNVSVYSDSPNIPSLLSISDIIIHSSLGEGCSNAILEASAAGLIVVASDTGGTKEIVNQWSFLYQYKNVDELVVRIKDAIKLLRSVPLVRQKIQSVTKDKFSVESLINNYTLTINKILNYHSH